MRRKLLLGFALAAVLLGLFLYNTDLREMGAALSQAHPAPLLLAFALQILTFYFRAHRWRLLLGRKGSHVPLSSLFNICTIGFMVNNFAPRGTGELARSYLIGRGHKVGISTTFATVVLERIFDFLTVLVLLAILLAGFDLPFASSGILSAERFRYLGWLISAGMLGVVVMLALLYTRSFFVLSVLRRLMRPLPERVSAKVLSLLATFIEGLSCLTSLRALAGVILHSALLWGWIFISFILVLRAFDLELPIQAPMLLIVLSVFSMFVPSPGGLGAMHWAVGAGLSLFGIVPPLSQAVAVAAHATGYLSVIVLGVICLRLEGLDFSQLRKAEESAEDVMLHPGSSSEPVPESLA